MVSIREVDPPGISAGLVSYHEIAALGHITKSLHWIQRHNDT